MLECLVDGEITDRISAADRGLQYGDGLFETMAVIGGQPRFWQGHMDRLNTGCEQLGIPLAPQSVLLREVKTVAAGQQRCVVKIIFTRGTSGRGYLPRTPDKANRIVSSHAWPKDPGSLVETGIRTRICDLRLGIQPALAGLKHLNRLEQVTARSEWSDRSIHEGILLDHEDHVVSAISSNIFLVYSGRLLTPRLDRCGVRGVMRGAILNAFRELGSLLKGHEKILADNGGSSCIGGHVRMAGLGALRALFANTPGTAGRRAGFPTGTGGHRIWHRPGTDVAEADPARMGMAPAHASGAARLQGR
jgi:4-amino-4-deoxychorismate lyase